MIGGVGLVGWVGELPLIFSRIKVKLRCYVSEYRTKLVQICANTHT